MAKKFEDILSESKFGNEQKAIIQEAWETKLSEAREEIAANLREEFSSRFEHDKSVLVESMDSFLTDRIEQEITELAEDKNKLIAERIKYKKQVAAHATMLEKFITESLAKEVKELRADKVKMNENFNKLENFVLTQLSEEIKDFHSDKKALVEQRVKMVREGKAKLQEAKEKFIKRAAQVTETTINTALRSELKQLKEDITLARDNEFGRKIFEAFQMEFTSSHLNEGTMVAKLKNELNESKSILESLKAQVNEKAKLVESTQTKLKVSGELAQRKEIMSEMLSPLNRDQKAVMTELLESTATAKLKLAFEKYLPAVLNESVKLKEESSKTVLSESRRVERTGDKPGTAQQNNEVIDLASMKRLAGI